MGGSDINRGGLYLIGRGSLLVKHLSLACCSRVDVAAVVLCERFSVLRKLDLCACVSPAGLKILGQNSEKLFEQGRVEIGVNFKSFRK